MISYEVGHAPPSEISYVGSSNFQGSPTCSHGKLQTICSCRLHQGLNVCVKYAQGEKDCYPGGLRFLVTRLTSHNHGLQENHGDQRNHENQKIMKIQNPGFSIKTPSFLTRPFFSAVLGSAGR